MKSPYYVLIGIAIGLVLGIVVYPLIINPSENDETNTEILSDEQSNEQEDSDQNSKRTTQNEPLIIDPNNLSRSRGITPAEADALFQDYHDSPDHNNSQGLLTVEINNTTETLIHFYLDKKLVVDPLTDQLAPPNDSTLVGFAGLLASNPNTNSHTMIWVAVVETADNKKYYYLPLDNQPANKTHIYDYVSVCPPECPENEDRLWKKEWAE